MSVQLLVIDDTESDRTLIRDYFSAKGFDVIEAKTGEEGVSVFKAKNPQMVVLDFSLPDGQGPDFCKQLKSISQKTPVILLTVRSEVSNKVFAFRSGCDDYLTKPCELEELEIRINNLLKRTQESSDETLVLGSISIHRPSRKVTKDGHRINLTVKEYALLEYLMLHRNEVLSRTMILEQVWGESSSTFTNIVDVYITYLRKKLNLTEDNPTSGDPTRGEPTIKTVRGLGYMMEDEIPKSKAA